MQLTRRHTQRLRQMLRSAGWPMLDVLEAELLTAGLLQRVPGSAGAETLRVTDAGLAAIAASAVSNRAALSAHEALVQRVATELARAGRIVWRGLGLRVPLPPVDGSNQAPALAGQAPLAINSEVSEDDGGLGETMVPGAPKARWLVA